MTRPAQTDVEILYEIARHRFLTTRQLALRFAPEPYPCDPERLARAHAAMYARLKRMSTIASTGREPLTIKARGHHGVTCWVATPLAHHAHGFDLPPVRAIGVSTARHVHLTAEVAIRYAREGWHTTTEIEVRGEREMAADKKYISGELTARDAPPVHEHLPDLVITHPDRRSIRRAVEIELSVKKAAKLRQKLAWYAKQSGFERVTYLCGDRAVANALHEASERWEGGSSGRLQIVVLRGEFLQIAVQH